MAKMQTFDNKQESMGDMEMTKGGGMAGSGPTGSSRSYPKSGNGLPQRPSASLPDDVRGDTLKPI